MRVANDLNTYTPQGTAIGDFRVSDPVNGWEGASGDVIIFQRFVGGHDWQFQIGVDAVTDSSRAPDLFARMRFRQEPWGEWTAAGAKPPPVEPPAEPPVVPPVEPPPEITPPTPEEEE